MTGATLTAAALAYAAAGRPVLPCRGQVPAIPKAAGGNGVHDATTDPNRIQAWWRQMPWANIGLACGEPSGFWVLDVDPRHGGDVELAQLEAERGPLPETVEQLTGGGGRHLLFRWNGEPVKNRAGERHGLPPGLDTRATGGYIVAAPSIHPKTGRVYRWRPGRRALAHAPAWLVALVAPAEPPRPEVPAVRIAGMGTRYGEAALRRELDALRATSEGGRNVALNRAAFSLAQLAAGGALDLAVAASALAAAALATGLPAREVERTIASGIRAGLAQPREISR